MLSPIFDSKKHNKTIYIIKIIIDINKYKYFQGFHMVVISSSTYNDIYDFYFNLFSKKN